MTTVVISERAVKELQLKDAKASLSAVVDDAVKGTPSIITRHGKPEAIVLGMKDWERLSRVPSLARLLMSAPLDKGDLPRRSKSPMRRLGQ
jgi:prevent-host-death family protein